MVSSGPLRPARWDHLGGTDPPHDDDILGTATRQFVLRLVITRLTDRLLKLYPCIVSLISRLYLLPTPFNGCLVLTLLRRGSDRSTPPRLSGGYKGTTEALT